VQWLAGRAKTATTCGIVKRRFVCKNKMPPHRKQLTENANLKKLPLARLRQSS
jgi:hypothetical protein